MGRNIHFQNPGISASICGNARFDPAIQQALLQQFPEPSVVFGSEPEYEPEQEVYNIHTGNFVQQSIGRCSTAAERRAPAPAGRNDLYTPRMRNDADFALLKQALINNGFSAEEASDAINQWRRLQSSVPVDLEMLERTILEARSIAAVECLNLQTQQPPSLQRQMSLPDLKDHVECNQENRALLQWVLQSEGFPEAFVRQAMQHFVGQSVGLRNLRLKICELATTANEQVAPAESNEETASSPGVSNEEANVHLQRLLEERAKERTCKVCLDAQSNTAFRPCGHMQPPQTDARHS